VKVTPIDEEGIALEGPNGTSGSQRIPCCGRQVSLLLPGQDACGKSRGKDGSNGRVIVNPDLTVPGHPEIFVIAIWLICPGKTETLCPLSPRGHATGRYVARSIGKRLRGEHQAALFYFDKGTMAVIGRHEAVANIGRFRFGGIMAWLMWLFIHLLLLINFESRLVVLVRWAFSYFTHSRGSRVLLAVGH